MGRDYYLPEIVQAHYCTQNDIDEPALSLRQALSLPYGVAKRVGIPPDHTSRDSWVRKVLHRAYMCLSLCKLPAYRFTAPYDRGQ